MAAQASPLRIAHLYFNGNKTTKSDVIRYFLRIDTGSIFDSAKIKAAKKRLTETNLFIKVDILHLKKPYGVDLYIIVKEPFYIALTSLDLTPYTSRYGQRGTWYCPLAGVEFTNLRGRMENLRLTIRAWEWRTFAASWSKPLLPSRYFIGIGALTDWRPDNAINLDRMEIAGSLTAGKKCFERSRVFLSIIPDYQRKIIRDTGLFDTTHFYQTFGALGWYTDTRSSLYDPWTGWTFFFEGRSNYLYHQQTTPAYIQFGNETKFYHPGFAPNHRVAYRLGLVSRTNDAGIQNRLTLGGTTSLRGYGNSAIDLRRNANASFLFSTEYRFAIYQVPTVQISVPSRISNLLSKFLVSVAELSPRFDGAFIVDYGRVARHIDNIFSLDGVDYVSGTDVGFGLRLLEPSFRWSGCFDVVWVQDPQSFTIDILPTPSLNLYLNMPF